MSGPGPDELRSLRTFTEVRGRMFRQVGRDCSAFRGQLRTAEIEIAYRAGGGSPDLVRFATQGAPPALAGCVAARLRDHRLPALPITADPRDVGTLEFDTSAGHARLVLDPPIALATVQVRLDAGLTRRALASARLLAPLRRGFDVTPTALFTGEVGVDRAGAAAWDAAALVGFAVAPSGAALGLYGGIATSDPGSAGPSELSVPVELALSTLAARFGVEAFARVDWLLRSDSPRTGGSERAPSKGDELSLGLAARVPGPFGRSLLVGVRYHELLGGRLIGLWIGADLHPGR